MKASVSHHGLERREATGCKVALWRQAAHLSLTVLVHEGLHEVRQGRHTLKRQTIVQGCSASTHRPVAGQGVELVLLGFI
mmetsp:Transcript_71466/g.99257  ORF Transcript_71466/g.99257 Transcript_71466/m.99257 type:complete len:80 (-) Transcript_71466:1020-1259(-)